MVLGFLLYTFSYTAQLPCQLLPYWKLLSPYFTGTYLLSVVPKCPIQLLCQQIWGFFPNKWGFFPNVTRNNPISGEFSPPTGDFSPILQVILPFMPNITRNSREIILFLLDKSDCVYNSNQSCGHSERCNE